MVQKRCFHGGEVQGIRADGQEPDWCFIPIVDRDPNRLNAITVKIDSEDAPRLFPAGDGDADAHLVATFGFGPLEKMGVVQRQRIEGGASHQDHMQYGDENN